MESSRPADATQQVQGQSGRPKTVCSRGREAWKEEGEDREQRKMYLNAKETSKESFNIKECCLFFLKISLKMVTGLI